jgi:signal transduction histidine kinase
MPKVRLLPKSLFGRMVLILLAGLLLAQLASTALLLRDRGDAVYHTSGRHLAQRIAQTVQLLDPLSAQERQRTVAALDTAPLRVSLAEAPGVALEPAELGQRAAFFRGVLRRLLGDRPILVVVQEDSAVEPWPRRRHGLVEAPEHKRRPMHEAGAAPVRTPAFAVEVRLQDGAWVRFDHRIAEDEWAWPRRLLLWLAVLLASVLAISLLAVRWLTRPLALLASAAERLGRDITSAPLAERGPLEVRRAARAFNDMQTRLLRYIEDRTRVLGAVSHDLKTPITRLRLRAESLTDEALRAKVIKDLDEMEAMVGATLDFLRSAGSEEPVQPIDVAALLESLQADAEEAGREVRLEGRVRAPYPGHPLSLKRCLGNLVDNALLYAGRAFITVEDGPEQLRIVVADDGPGIPETELEQVFEPFYRLEASRSRHTGGTGLGLGIARNIARAHGGELTVRNRRAGTGLEAVLTLPR